MFTWLGGHEVLLWWIGAISILSFFGTVLAAPALVAYIPADYFSRARRSILSGSVTLSGRYIAGLIVKNMIGLVLVIMGIAMLILPGQGIITILLGLFLMNFPGKRQLERRIIGVPAVLKAINWIRRRGNRSPLEV